MTQTSWFYATLVPALAAIFAGYAAVWRFRAMVHGKRGWETTHGVIGALAVFYAVAWALLALHIVTDRAAWSQYVGTISAVTFVVVWALPARKQVKDRQR